MRLDLCLSTRSGVASVTAAAVNEKHRSSHWLSKIIVAANIIVVPSHGYSNGNATNIEAGFTTRYKLSFAYDRCKSPAVGHVYRAALLELLLECPMQVPVREKIEADFAKEDLEYNALKRSVGYKAEQKTDDIAGMGLTCGSLLAGKDSASLTSQVHRYENRKIPLKFVAGETCLSISRPIIQ